VAIASHCCLGFGKNLPCRMLAGVCHLDRPSPFARPDVGKNRAQLRGLIALCVLYSLPVGFFLRANLGFQLLVRG
jgi:hypothetical protein